MINIVLATDDNFVQHCSVLMLSILEHNHDIHFYILTESLRLENIKYMNDLVKARKGLIDICNVPSAIVKYFPMSNLASSHISVSTYYRLFVTSLLPETIHKVIYLDCDMIVRGSLYELWNTNIEDKAIAAVYQNFSWSDHNDCWNRLSIPRKYGYFNAGCLLMNLDYLRKVDFQGKAVEYINKNMDRIISHDQDVLNSLLYDKVSSLSCKWNFLSLFLLEDLDDMDFPSYCKYISERNSHVFEPIIVHFVSKPKPWHFGCKNPYVTEYYQYLSITKWADYKPPFIFRQYLTFVVIPRLKSFLKSLDIFGISEKYHLQKVRKQYNRIL